MVCCSTETTILDDKINCFHLETKEKVNFYVDRMGAAECFGKRQKSIYYANVINDFNYLFYALTLGVLEDDDIPCIKEHFKCYDIDISEAINCFV